MLFRLVRPMRRSGSRNRYYVKRIPSDVRRKVTGVTLAIPFGDNTQTLTITPRTQAIRVSLRTDEPAEVKARQAAVDAYGARHQGLKGIVALAPAHPAEILAQRSDIGNSIEQARRLIANGQGDTRTTFSEINTGRTFTVTTTPKIYLSFHGVNSIAVMPANAAKLTAPLLVVAGTQDATQRGQDYVFNKAPKNKFNRYVLVQADHRGTPAAGLHAVMEWFKELEGR